MSLTEVADLGIYDRDRARKYIIISKAGLTYTRSYCVPYKLPTENHLGWSGLLQQLFLLATGVSIEFFMLWNAKRCKDNSKLLYFRFI